MRDCGHGTVTGTSRTSELYDGRYPGPTDLSASAKRFTTSPIDDPEDLDLSDENDLDEDDDDYWDLDELGIDPEEFYNLCPNSRSARR